MRLSLVKVPPLGECPKDKGGAASGEEAPANERVRDCIELFERSEYHNYITSLLLQSISLRSVN